MKTLVLITAFNVEKFLEDVVMRIPKEIKSYNPEILIINDFSRDNTLQKMREIKGNFKDFKVTCLTNKTNLGYGGNQKLGYHYAIKNNFDYVVMLHGDGQYAPESIIDMIKPLAENKCSAVQGSRMIKKMNALKGKMPLYKFFGNIFLTYVQNLLSGLKMSEYHSGYRAYSVKALKKIPFNLNSKYFHFDTQILLQLKVVNENIFEIPIPTFYGEQISSLKSIQYGFAILKTTIIFYLQKFGIFHDIKFSFSNKDGPSNYLPKLNFLSTHSIAFKKIKENSKILSIGCGNADLEKELIERKNCIVDGLDSFDVKGLNFLNSFKVINYDKEIFELDFKGYDYILFLDVIEHLKKPEEFMNSLNNKMSFFPDQKLIISTPNIANIFIRLSLLIGNFNYGKRGILDKTHTRLFTLSSFKKIILENNFLIKETIAIPPPFPLAIKNNFISKLLLNFFKYLNLISKTVFAFQFLSIVESKPNLDYLLDQAKK